MGARMAFVELQGEEGMLSSMPGGSTGEGVGLTELAEKQADRPWPVQCIREGR